MSLFKKSNIRGSSRRQVAIKGVKDDILELPGKKYRAILKVSSINFELKSEAEQDAIIESYQSFLNSLTTSIQILVRIREKDVDGYLDRYSKRLEVEEEQVYRDQIEAYTRFVKGLVRTNKILTRQFYVVVPFQADRSTTFDHVKDQLALDVGIIERGLAKLGVQARRLTDLEILELFHGFYKTDTAKDQPLTDKTMEMLSKQFI